MSISTRSRTRSSQPTTPGPDAEPDAPAGGPRPRRAAPLVGGQRRAATDVARRPLRGLLGLAVGVELLGRAVAGIGRDPRPAAAAAASAYAPAAASGGTARTGPTSPPPADGRALVPLMPEPVEAVEDVALERLGAAGDVGVLEPEHERPAGVAGEQVVEQGRARGADVEGPRGAGRDADAVDGHGPIVGAVDAGPGARSAAQRRRHLVEQRRDRRRR